MQMHVKSYEGNEGPREMLLGQQKMYCILGLIGFIMLFDVLLMSKCEAHHYDFFLQEINYTRLCSTKRILTVNGNFPGPTIKVRKGDTFYVNVHNQGAYGVTIHWHGVKQPRNPWYDGPENITQCPIKPGSNFTYEVILSTEEGTLWWHAHSDWTRATIHGAIIILPALGTTYPFPNPRAEETIIIGSWYKGDVMAVIDDALATGGSPNVSDAFTINGQPGDLYPCSSSSTYRLLVDFGNLYLLRIINAVMNEDQFFGIARHKLVVVGQDGAYIKPITTDYIMITPGQTMDVLVRAEQLPSFYYMASTPFFDNNIVRFDNTTTTAIFQYRSSRTHPPSSIPFPSLPNYNDIGAAMRFTRRVKSLATKKYPIQVPLKIATRLFITVSVNELLCPNATCAGPNGMRVSASLNNVSFVTPRIDILQAYYRGLNGAVFQDDFPSVPPYYFNFTGDNGNVSVFTKRGTKVKMLNYGEAVEIVFQGTNLLAPESHPMHVHGYSFYKVGTGTGNFNQRTDPQTYNLIDPPHINTISVPKNGWTAVRFYADNPGVWFMHCHLERHASWGMETVLIVKNGLTKLTSIRPPPSYMPPCS